MATKPKKYYQAEKGVRFPGRSAPDYQEFQDGYMQQMRDSFGGQDVELREVKVPVSKLVAREGVREPLRQKMYEDMLRGGESLPPVVVQKKGGQYHILDGDHRHAAAVNSGVKVLNAFEVVPVKKPLWYQTKDGFDKIPSRHNPARADWDAQNLANVKSYFGDDREYRQFNVPLDQIAGSHDVADGHPRTALYTRMYREGDAPAPVVGRYGPTGLFELLDGNRRNVAAKKAGRTDIPAIEIREPQKAAYKGPNPDPFGTGAPKRKRYKKSEPWWNTPGEGYVRPIDLTKDMSMEGTKKVGSQLGSNPGGVYADQQGKKYYFKFQPSTDHARNEMLAARLYQAGGHSALDLQPLQHDKGIGTASEWQPAERLDLTNLEHRQMAKRSFAMHAWLANWDGIVNDNMALVGGKPTTMDTGGALLFRAMGGPKGKHFGHEVTEFHTLRDPNMNWEAADVFGEMTPEEIMESVSSVAKVDDSTIESLVLEHGPGSMEERRLLAEKLKTRKRNLIEQAQRETGIPLVKGSMERLHPFNPKYDVGNQERQAVGTWMDQGFDDEIPGVQKPREAIPEMHPDAKARALHKLAGMAQVRRGLNGEREFLLYRGMGPKEAPYVSEDYYHNPSTHSSWTPYAHIADDYDTRDGKGMYGVPGAAAWIPESAIHHVIGAIGPQADTYNRSGEWRPGRQPTPMYGLGAEKEKFYDFEHEVIVKPGRYELGQRQGRTQPPVGMRPPAKERLGKSERKRPTGVPPGYGEWVKHPKFPERIQQVFDAIRHPEVMVEKLRKPKYRNHPNRFVGHCYAASEAAYHLLNGEQTGWKVRRGQHEGDTHWFLYHPASDTVFDPTAEQFKTPVPYKTIRAAGGKPAAGGFLTKEPSDRARQMMEAVRTLLGDDLTKSEEYSLDKFEVLNKVTPPLGIKRPDKPVDLSTVQPSGKGGMFGSTIEDYSHLLPPEARGSYKLHVFSYKEHGDRDGELYEKKTYHRVYAKLYPASATFNIMKPEPVAQVEGFFDENGFEPHIDQLKDRQAVGLIPHVLTAALGHARNKLGARVLKVPTHTPAAANVIRRYVKLIGGEYQGRPIPNTLTDPDFYDDYITRNKNLYSGFDVALKDEMDPNYVGELHRDPATGRFMVKSEQPLEKAISDIPPGQLLVQNPKSGEAVYDYSHLVHPAWQGQGLNLTVRVQPKAKALTALVTQGDTVVGTTHGNWNLHKGSIGLKVHSTLIPEENWRGKRFGQAMYEALMAHAKHVLGATHMYGDEHSTAAAQVHKKLARKHGLLYKPQPNVGGFMYPTQEDWMDTPSHDDDGKYKAYEYMLKGEYVPADKVRS